jgi:hypothetical protein
VTARKLQALRSTGGCKAVAEPTCELELKVEVGPADFEFVVTLMVALNTCQRLFASRLGICYGICVIGCFYRVFTYEMPGLYWTSLTGEDREAVGYQDAVRSLIPVNLEGLRANAAKSTIGG